MNTRGITLIEVLLACVLVAIVAGAVAALAGPLRDALARFDGAAQLEPAARAAVEGILFDLREAGAGPVIGDLPWRLSDVMPTASPLRDLASSDPVANGQALRVRRTAFGAAQGRLDEGVAAGTSILVLDTEARCAGGPPACNFRAADIGVVFTDTAAELVTVSAVGEGTVVLTRPITTAFPAGAVLTTLITNTYGLRDAADGSRQLVRISTGGAEQPVLDHVVDFDVASDTADLSRTARIAVRLRLEAPSRMLRGPVGYLFRRAGSAVHARQWLPDVEMSLTVALRNPAGV